MSSLNRIAAGLVVTSVIALSAFVGGCSDTPTSTDTSATVTQAKQGSTFTSYAYSKDSTGQKVPDSDDTLTATITQTGLTMGGKTGVNMVIETGKNGTDTSYFRYETNGDVSIYYKSDETSMQGVALASTWITLPFGSKTPQNATLVDTTITDATVGQTKLKVTSAATQTGTENVTVGTETLSAQKVQWNINVSASFLLGSFTSSSNSTILFAPKIGYLVRQEATTSTMFGGVSSVEGSSVQALFKYSLK